MSRCPKSRTTPPSPTHPGLRNVFADACGECGAPAAWMCEPYCPAVLGAEFLHLDEGRLDRVTCVEDCGNDAHGQFHPVLPDGRVGEIGNAWAAAGALVSCGSCGRVFSQMALIETQYAQVLYTLPATGSPSA